MKLKHIHQALSINASPEKIWQTLSRYGDVSRFHAGVVESHKEIGSDDEASMGCERICNIVDMGLKIVLKERIVDYVEGESYRYEVYEWKNFPIRKMYFGFEIVTKPHALPSLALNIDYKARPGFLTPLLAGKMKRLAHDVLLGYKHYIETGEVRVPIKELKTRYQFLKQDAMQYS